MTTTNDSVAPSTRRIDAYRKLIEARQGVYMAAEAMRLAAEEYADACFATGREAARNPISQADGATD